MNRVGSLKSWMSPVEEISPFMFYGRCAWVVVRLIAAYWFANQVSPFFYQRF